MHQSFERKKKKKKLYRGRVGTSNFFAEFHKRDHPVSLQSNSRSLPKVAFKKSQNIAEDARVSNPVRRLLRVNTTSFPLIKNPERSEQVYPRDFWPEQARKLQETARNRASGPPR